MELLKQYDYHFLSILTYTEIEKIERKKVADLV